MNFTVLGSRGFIGRNLCSFLLSEGHEVLRPEPKEILENPRNWGHVVYCIGLTADFRQRPFDTMEAHVGLLGDILQKSSFESFVYLSSTRVYMGAASTDEEANLTVNPNSASDLYNISKLAGESMCLCSGKKNVRVARLSNVVGYDVHSQNFIQAVIKEALAGKIELQAHPESEKDFIGVQDVAKLLTSIAVRGKQPIYNVASGKNTVFKDILENIKTLTGCEVVTHDTGDVQTFLPIDIRRSETDFDFRPEPFISGLKDLLDEYLLNTKEG